MIELLVSDEVAVEELSVDFVVDSAVFEVDALVSELVV